jgi:hypothetical protein
MEKRIGIISDGERNKPLSKRASIAIIASEVLATMSGPYDNGSIMMSDFSVPERRDMRAEKGSKGNLERDRNNKYTKKIYGRGR